MECIKKTLLPGFHRTRNEFSRLELQAWYLYQWSISLVVSCWSSLFAKLHWLIILVLYCMGPSVYPPQSASLKGVLSGPCFLTREAELVKFAQSHSNVLQLAWEIKILALCEYLGVLLLALTKLGFYPCNLLGPGVWITANTFHRSSARTYLIYEIAQQQQVPLLNCNFNRSSSDTI